MRGAKGAVIPCRGYDCGARDLHIPIGSKPIAPGAPGNLADLKGGLMYSKIWQRGDFVMIGALCVFLMAGASYATAQARGGNPNSNSARSNAPAPKETQRPARSEAGRGSNANNASTRQRSQNFKVEIEGVTAQPTSPR